MTAKHATCEFRPNIVTNARGEEVESTIPVSGHQVLDRVNKALAGDRQRLLRDGDRIVWVDLRQAREIDLEEFARKHGHMEPTEKMIGE